VPKLKESLEDEKKMLELKSENIQPESNSLDMFSMMKAVFFLLKKIRKFIRSRR
jgi:hypothetical protein